MMCPIDQIDRIRNRHPAARFDAFQGGLQFVAIFWGNADYASVALSQPFPHSWANLTFGETCQIIDEVHFRQFLLCSQFLLPLGCRWTVRTLSHARNTAIGLDPRQANHIIRVSVPVRVRPPATLGVAPLCGGAARLPGCTISRPRDILCRSAQFLRVPRHRFLVSFAVSGRPCTRGRG